MRDKVSIKNIVLTGFATVMFSVIFVVFYKDETSKMESESPDVVIMGDSIIAYTCGTDYNIEDNLSEMTGLTVAECAFGGTRMAYLDAPGRLDVTFDALSVNAMLRAKASNDYRYQEAALSVRDMTATYYFDDRFERFKGISLTETKVIIIENMVNDYHDGIPVRNELNAYDEYTYEGALRGTIELLNKSYPNLKVVLAMPPTTWYADKDGYISSHEKDFGGGTIDVYKETAIKMASEYGVDVIDIDVAYDGMNEDNIFDYSIDGLHPQWAHSVNIAKLFADYLVDLGI